MQTQKVKGTATGIFQLPGRTQVSYHNTVVVDFDYSRGTIILNTGGWKTATTKLRMNQTSNQFGLGYQVYQKNHSWYVRYHGEVIPFDGDKLELKIKASE